MLLCYNKGDAQRRRLAAGLASVFRPPGH